MQYLIGVIVPLIPIVCVHEMPKVSNHHCNFYQSKIKVEHFLELNSARHHVLRTRKILGGRISMLVHFKVYNVVLIFIFYGRFFSEI